MSPVADSSLFDSAVSQMLHIPETLEKLVFPHPRAAEDGGHCRHHAGGGGHEEKGFGGPPADIFDGPKAYVFYVDVPGLSKSDIQVMLEEEKVLVIKSNGKRKREEGEEEGCKYLRLERRAAPKFMRKFKLPEDSSPAAVSAKCENGVLTVTVEKVAPPPETKPKRVEVAIAWSSGCMGEG